MRLWELYHTVEDDLYDPDADILGTRHRTDARKPVITLRDINRLKHERRRRASEDRMHADRVADMYGNIPDLDLEKDALAVEKQRIELEKAKLDIAAKREERASRSALVVHQLAGDWLRGNC